MQNLKKPEQNYSRLISWFSSSLLYIFLLFSIPNCSGKKPENGGMKKISEKNIIEVFTLSSSAFNFTDQLSKFIVSLLSNDCTRREGENILKINCNMQNSYVNGKIEEGGSSKKIYRASFFISITGDSKRTGGGEEEEERYSPDIIAFVSSEFTLGGFDISFSYISVDIYFGFSEEISSEGKISIEGVLVSLSEDITKIRINNGKYSVIWADSASILIEELNAVAKFQKNTNSYILNIQGKVKVERSSCVSEGEYIIKADVAVIRTNFNPTQGFPVLCPISGKIEVNSSVLELINNADEINCSPDITKYFCSFPL